MPTSNKKYLSRLRLWLVRPIAYSITYYIAYALASTLIIATPSPGLAQGNPQNLLQITAIDPLLPPDATDRELTEPERQRLITALTELEQQATTFLQAGDLDNTVLVWNRLLRLSRSLGTIPEIQALGRIGEIAWNQGITKEVNLISDRLQVIQRTATQLEKLDLAMLQALGTAYQQLRSPNLAIPIYQQILTQAKAAKDVNAIETNLRILGLLHMGWFDYPQAALTYQELFELEISLNDFASQITYLQELAYIYDQLKDQEKSIATKQKLITYYKAKAELQPKIPSLLIEIAASYGAIRNPQAARDNYQLAYETAIAGKLFAAARDALQGLALLYQNYNQPNTAIEIYQILVQVNQQSYDYYYSMNAYDQMGQIYLQQKNYSQALGMFTEGLKIARLLRYQELYFAAQVERTRGFLVNIP